MKDPTKRFSDKVEQYARYRPGYPREIVQHLERTTGLSSTQLIADVGSGTGISARIFLEHGNRVIGIEPNREMRAAAEKILSGFERFISVEGRAEETSLGRETVDYVVAAQAFHWFDIENARAEFRRILRPDGWTVLIWNERRLDSTPFLRAYEAMLVEFGTDYKDIRHENVTGEKLAGFFESDFASAEFDNVQVLDRAGLRGRLLSTSYIPAPGEPRHDEMLHALDRIFDEHAEEGLVRFDYVTRLYCGRLR